MKKIFLILSALVLILGIGCKKGYLDVNTNPNQSTSADPSFVLPAALAVTVASWYPGPTSMSGWMGSWAISGSYAISSTDFSTYKMTSDFAEPTATSLNNVWGVIYDNMEDYQYIINKSSANNQPFLEGVARIMKSYQAQHLVDLFNDVPYTDALKGVLSLRPAYSKGIDVYDSLFIEINKGINLIKNAPTTVSASSDIMFKGNQTLWIQFANTVRLRMLLRMSELAAKPAYFQPNLDLTKNQTEGFLSVDALVQPGYVNSTGKGNPFWQRFYNLTGGQIASFGDFWAPNEFAVNFYKSNNDPRLAQEYSPVASSGKVIGNKLGLTNGNPTNGNYSLFGPGVLKAPDAPAVMMLAAESDFLQAEASALGYISGNDQSLYQMGIKASFKYLGASDNGISSDSSAVIYYSQPGNIAVNYSTATSILAKQTIILRQKWAALNSINSFEAYADYRRFDYLHTGTPPYAGPLGNTPLSVSPYIDIAKIPLRYKYPTSEFSKNPDNVSKEGTIDHQVNKIWWMK